MIPNCSTYSNTGDCTGCDTNYTLVRSSCYPTIPHCSVYNGNGSCKKCEKGYNVINNQCYSTSTPQTQVVQQACFMSSLKCIWRTQSAWYHQFTYYIKTMILIYSI